MELVSQMPALVWVAVVLVAAGAGIVKGLVGFAMPMVMISGLSSAVAPELALAGLILPTLAANLWQALRQGLRAALESVRKFRVFLGVGLIFLLAAAQMVRLISGPVLLLMIGVPITLYALLTLAGRPLRLPRDAGPSVEGVIGAVAGFFGGISGIWGPPTVALLTARETEKSEQMRVQGVIYGLGAVALTAAHVGSGVLNPATVPFSLALVPPAVLGMWLGFQLHDRIDQAFFRKATLAVLLLAGLNLIRRGVMAL